MPTRNAVGSIKKMLIEADPVGRPRYGLLCLSICSIIVKKKPPTRTIFTIPRTLSAGPQRLRPGCQ
jgi:hypothetical protein